MFQKRYAFICLTLLILGSINFVNCKPSMLSACLMTDCEIDSGPVCGIDESGVARTFENRCMSDLEFCKYGSFVVELKPGEC